MMKAIALPTNCDCELDPGVQDWFNNLPGRVSMMVLEYVLQSLPVRCPAQSLNMAHQLYKDSMEIKKLQNAATLN